MSVQSILSTHEDHRRWSSDHATWRTDILKWRAEYDYIRQAVAQLIERHDEALIAHAQAVDEHDQEIREHEHAIAALESGHPLLSQDVLDREHAPARHCHAEQDATHKRMKEHHRRVMVAFQQLLSALNAAE